MNEVKINLADDSRIFIKGYYLDEYQKLGQKDYPTVLLVPGGGFNAIPEQEAERICLAFLNAGYNAFFLRYHLFADLEKPIMPQPLIDLAYAVKTLRENETEYHMNGDLTIMGLSIGGEIVTQYNGRYIEQWLQDKVGATVEQLKPNRVVLGYPVTNFSEGFPKTKEALDKMTDDEDAYYSAKYLGPHSMPTFIWTTWNDEVVHSMNTISYVKALRENEVPAEVHIFDRGPHGMALATEQTSEKPDEHLAHWFPLCLEWIKRN